MYEIMFFLAMVGSGLFLSSCLFKLYLWFSRCYIDGHCRRGGKND